MFLLLLTSCKLRSFEVSFTKISILWPGPITKLLVSNGLQGDPSTEIISNSTSSLNLKFRILALAVFKSLILALPFLGTFILGLKDPFIESLLP